MNCTNCGQPLEDGAVFCKNCGTRAPQAAGAPTQQVPRMGASGADSAPPPPPQAFPPPPPPQAYQQVPPSAGWQPPQGPPAYSPPPPPGYGPGWQVPQGPPPGRPRRTGLIVGIVAATLVVLAGIGVGVYFALRGDSDKTSSDTTGKSGSTTTLEVAFVQGEGEIFLEPAGVAGPESFAGEVFVPLGPTTTLNIPGTTLPGKRTTTVTTKTTGSGTTASTGATQVATYSGDTPALYGGSKNKLLVDKEGQLRFFEQNPDKAAAFCAALNADPTFKWSGGNQIQPSQLRAYFDELTPLMLTRDTRVTNHGFRDGKPTPRQSVLQKGQMVLVDRYGVPRVRCECGNPLTPPKPVQKAPTYTGPRWPDFDPATVIVVQPTVVVINIFVVIDINTGEIFDRPPGTDGTEDVVHEAGVWQLDVEMSWNDTENQHLFTVNWTGVVRLDPETGELTGEGAGQWHVEGAYFEGSTVIGQMTGDGSLGVELTGQREENAGERVLSIFPLMTTFSIDDQSWEGGDSADAQAEFESVIQDIIASSFPQVIETSPGGDAPVFIDLAVNDWVGSATLSPYRE